MIQHILFACDMSPTTDRLFKQVLELARTCQAQVTLLHAYPQLPAFDQTGLESNELQDLDQAMNERATRRLRGFKEELEAGGIMCGIVIQRGHTGQLIVATARQKACDLIVLGRHGPNYVHSLLLGSTNTYVLHHAPCPVMSLPNRAVAA